MIEKIFNLKNKIAVITGGLGILGTVYAQTLAEAGAKVAVFDVIEPLNDHKLKKLSKKFPIKFFKVDIARRPQVENALKEIKKSWGTPNILINNAAIDFPPDKVGEKPEDYPIDKWNKMIEVNLTGMLICCQVLGAEMAKNKGGSIVNISSHYGIVSPDQRIYTNFFKPVSYSVTKSGVLNLTRYFATYWGDKNVRVNTFTPGGVFNNQNEDFIKKYSDRVPLGRMANREEYRGVILFLASDASSYMTGSNLIIDGGWTAW
ncbi:MAG: Oxidoreductase, short chain dehydrogenase/reductase family protein [Parcubacteria group bacterium GW2011_GWA1_42_7]|nr:MAG: Oxidoreductase, short chain dehydrogenase/reductase family protein [Parcubacteria group bacterium GW2011_GWA1_42_7]KKS91859.1 MAG: Oxidoreductase, short chain dehydrogenase/reductase family protein [Parcubacteria group bacterium GW2011_GWC1_43_12]